MIELRPATPEDTPAIEETLDLCFAEYTEWAPDWIRPDPPEAQDGFEARLASPEVWSLLAFDGGEPAGHVMVAESSPVPLMAAPPGHAKLWQIFIRPAWQGTGLATRLLRAAEREALERGFGRMALWTPRDNARARRFYEREGWAVSGRERLENPMGMPVVEYVRALR